MTSIKTARWQQLRKFQLMQHPLCKFCLERGIVTRANVVDHVGPHKRDWTDFITGELQSLCEPCHNSAKRQVELRGYRCDVHLRSSTAAISVTSAIASRHGEGAPCIGAVL